MERQVEVASKYLAPHRARTTRSPRDGTGVRYLDTRFSIAGVSRTMCTFGAGAAPKSGVRKRNCNRLSAWRMFSTERGIVMRFGPPHISVSHTPVQQPTLPN